MSRARRCVICSRPAGTTNTRTLTSWRRPRPSASATGLRPSQAELKDLEAAMEAPGALYGSEVAGGVCWHLALSTKGGVDRDLSDEEWAEVAREAVRQLGFDAGDGQAPCRWVAVRHGRSEAGNDHTHLVVNLVREDGKVASTRNDFKRLSALCTDMERRYGLSVVEGRAKKAAMPGLTRAEAEKARRTGQDEAERAELARVVRAAATVANSEAEFVRLLRDAGLAARPRYDRVGGHHVVGYAVAEEPSDGGVAVFFGGGKLAGTSRSPLYGNAGATARPRARTLPPSGLAAPRRRACTRPLGPAGTSPTAGPRPQSVGARRRSGKSTRRSAQRSPAGWKEATESLGEVVRRLGAVPAEDVTTWRAVASDAAGALAVLSGRLERSPGRWPALGPPGPLGPRAPATSRRAAGYVPRGTIKSVAALMAQADLDEGTPAAWRLLFAELLPGGPGGPRRSLGALRRPSRRAVLPARHVRLWTKRERVSARWRR